MPCWLFPDLALWPWNANDIASVAPILYLHPPRHVCFFLFASFFPSPPVLFYPDGPPSCSFFCPPFPLSFRSPTAGLAGFAAVPIVLPPGFHQNLFCFRPGASFRGVLPDFFYLFRSQNPTGECSKLMLFCPLCKSYTFNNPRTPSSSEEAARNPTPFHPKNGLAWEPPHLSLFLFFLCATVFDYPPPKSPPPFTIRHSVVKVPTGMHSCRPPLSVDSW